MTMLCCTGQVGGVCWDVLHAVVGAAFWLGGTLLPPALLAAWACVAGSIVKAQLRMGGACLMGLLDDGGQHV